MAGKDALISQPVGAASLPNHGNAPVPAFMSGPTYDSLDMLGAPGIDEETWFDILWQESVWDDSAGGFSDDWYDPNLARARMQFLVPLASWENAVEHRTDELRRDAENKAAIKREEQEEAAKAALLGNDLEAFGLPSESRSSQPEANNGDGFKDPTPWKLNLDGSGGASSGAASNSGPASTGNGPGTVGRPTGISYVDSLLVESSLALRLAQGAEWMTASRDGSTFDVTKLSLVGIAASQALVRELISEVKEAIARRDAPVFRPMIAAASGEISLSGGVPTPMASLSSLEQAIRAHIAANVANTIGLVWGAVRFPYDFLRSVSSFVDQIEDEMGFDVPDKGIAGIALYSLGASAPQAAAASQEISPLGYVLQALSSTESSALLGSSEGTGFLLGTDIDLDALLSKLEATGTRPTQTARAFSLDKLAKYVDAMNSGAFDWDAMNDRVIVDPAGAIMSGHHRILAATVSDSAIPESAFFRYARLTPRPQYDWEEIISVLFEQ